jgi:hypothetical protein
VRFLRVLGWFWVIIDGFLSDLARFWLENGLKMGAFGGFWKVDEI